MSRRKFQEQIPGFFEFSGPQNAVRKTPMKLPDRGIHIPCGNPRFCKPIRCRPGKARTCNISRPLTGRTGDCSSLPRVTIQKAHGVAPALLQGRRPMFMPAMPMAENGACPPEYSAQGNSFLSGANAKPAISENASCPIGWAAQSNYCVANSPDPKIVIPKNSPCPAGYGAQGNQCVCIKQGARHAIAARAAFRCGCPTR
ncbi:hypothetical protein [Comamonas sp. NLF-1-9]|uniref:hypothetical protein n=1 Tax=Comamonas sp. NLF-1-9 TaxID=2853163 RepID=UPI001C4977EA|nr:hypothetical protein [Comamonas sp. NLF-1-9]QXL84720.1 hypothetical protein KUD94_01605 [Comamonas sp. NLF-1-9]